MHYFKTSLILFVTASIAFSSLAFAQEKIINSPQVELVQCPSETAKIIITSNSETSSPKTLEKTSPFQNLIDTLSTEQLACYSYRFDTLTQMAIDPINEAREFEKNLKETHNVTLLVKPYLRIVLPSCKNKALLTDMINFSLVDPIDGSEVLGKALSIPSDLCEWKFTPAAKELLSKLLENDAVKRFIARKRIQQSESSLVKKPGLIPTEITAAIEEESDPLDPLLKKKGGKNQPPRKPKPEIP